VEWLRVDHQARRQEPAGAQIHTGEGQQRLLLQAVPAGRHGQRQCRRGRVGHIARRLRVQPHPQADLQLQLQDRAVHLRVILGKVQALDELRLASGSDGRVYRSGQHRRPPEELPDRGVHLDVQEGAVDGLHHGYAE